MSFFSWKHAARSCVGAFRGRISVGGGPFVVIAHSQGSMIAYDAPRSRKRDANVPLFVTLGSPLGLQEVQDQFKRFRKTRTLKVPACIGDWLNVADWIDPVALDKSLSSEFTPEKFIKDVRIWNKDSPRDPTLGTGYLSHDAVRGPVQQAVEVSLFSRSRLSSSRAIWFVSSKVMHSGAIQR